VGYINPIRSSRCLVFVDQPAEDVPPTNPPSSRRREQRWIIEWIRRPQVEAAVRTMVVEVADIGAKYSLEMAAP
jgi:hypothetical protein